MLSSIVIIFIAILTDFPSSSRKSCFEVTIINKLIHISVYNRIL